MNGNMINRHAQTLAEVQRMHDDLEGTRQHLTEAHREIDRLNNLVELLQQDKDKYYQEARMFERKLVQLCASVRNIGTLCVESMQVVQALQEDEHAEAEQESAAEMVRQLSQIAPQRGEDQH